MISKHPLFDKLEEKYSKRIIELSHDILEDVTEAINESIVMHPDPVRCSEANRDAVIFISTIGTTILGHLNLMLTYNLNETTAQSNIAPDLKQQCVGIVGRMTKNNVEMFLESTNKIAKTTLMSEKT